VLTFFAQDSQTHNLVYASADLAKATQSREVIAFCDHWKAVSSKDPEMLVMDQKVTNQAVLGELDARGVRFLTLRMRSAALIRHINSLTSKDYKTITLDRPSPHNKPKVHEDKAVRLTSYPGTVRQLVVTGLGRDQPTVIITNEHQATIRNLVSQYARRMTTEQRLAEIIRSFCTDALSSTVNLNVDLDIMLAVLAQALLAAFRARLGTGYATASPHTLQRRFLDSSGTITVNGDQVNRADRPPHLHTRPAPGQPPARHHRPLVARAPPALRVQLTQGRRSCMEIGASDSRRRDLRRSAAGRRGSPGPRQLAARLGRSGPAVMQCRDRYSRPPMWIICAPSPMELGNSSPARNRHRYVHNHDSVARPVRGFMITLCARAHE
jgi:hypothetical protein